MSFTELNVKLFRLINDLGKQFEGLNPIVAFIAENMLFLLAIVAISYLFTRKNENRLMILSAFIALIVAEITGKAAGLIHSNNQPFAELSNVNKLIDMGVNNSFPSDHTIIFFTFAVSFLLFKKRMGTLWVMLAVLVGFSRIWSGVHYPADVLVGALFGSLSAIFAYRSVPKIGFIRKTLKIEKVITIKANGSEYL